MWQEKHYLSIALLVSFVLPTSIGYAWGGWKEALGAFLLAGVARVVCVQHMTFFINSLCHTVGNRPYSTRCTARDSGIMAVFTFGEGYHNYHHEFQHDYRNGVKAWQFDPTKWAIWTLSKLGLVSQLRRVPAERIVLSEIAEKQRQLDQKLEDHRASVPSALQTRIQLAQQQLNQAAQAWELKKAEYTKAVEQKLAESRQKASAIQIEFEQATARLREAIEHWQQEHQLISAALT